MGGGSSVPRARSQFQIVSAELSEGSKNMSRDANLRLAFVNYIKTSEWLDQLATLVPHGLIKLNAVYADRFSSLAGKDGVLTSYQMTNEKLLDVQAIFSGGSLKTSISLSLSASMSPRPSRSHGSSFDRPHSSSFDSTNNVNLESYFNMNESSCFAIDQYMALLFHILYPLFLTSPQYKRYIKRGIEHGRSPDEDSFRSHPDSEAGAGSHHSLVPCQQSKRLQDILLGCAAYFDASLLEKHLEKPDWTDGVIDAIDNHSHGITVIDNRGSLGKILYANRAFTAIAEFTTEELNNANLTILNGPETEIAQLVLLQDAMKPKQSAKLGITYYSKSKRAFTDLVAIKSTACYSIMVHFAAVRGANVEDLKDVNDLVILLAQIMQPPTAPSSAAPHASNWLSAPLTSLISHLPSPSFLHSRAPSSSGSPASVNSRDSRASALRAGKANSGTSPMSIHSKDSALRGARAGGGSADNNSVNSERSQSMRSVSVRRNTTSKATEELTMAESTYEG